MENYNSFAETSINPRHHKMSLTFWWRKLHLVTLNISRNQGSRLQLLDTYLLSLDNLRDTKLSPATPHTISSLFHSMSNASNTATNTITIPACMAGFFLFYQQYIKAEPTPRTIYQQHHKHLQSIHLFKIRSHMPTAYRLFQNTLSNNTFTDIFRKIRLKILSLYV